MEVRGKCVPPPFPLAGLRNLTWHKTPPLRYDAITAGGLFGFTLVGSVFYPFFPDAYAF
jgi:hypothetical protein